jgi:hypothetical protein
VVYIPHTGIAITVQPVIVGVAALVAAEFFVGAAMKMFAAAEAAPCCGKHDDELRDCKQELK